MACVEANATMSHVPSVKTEGTSRGQEVSDATPSGVSRLLFIALIGWWLDQLRHDRKGRNGLSKS